MSFSGATAPEALVADMADRLGDAINDFKRQIERHDVRMKLVGTVKLVVGMQTYTLEIVPENGRYTVSVQASPSCSDVKTKNNSTTKKRNSADQDDEPNKRARLLLAGQGGKSASSNEHSKHQSMKTQDGSIDVADGSHRLSKEQSQQCNLQQRTDKASSPKDVMTATSFPSSEPCSKASPMTAVQRHVKLLSNQIKWIEDCRREDAKLHDEREQAWRTSSSTFHTRQMKDREAFQDKILEESRKQSEMLRLMSDEVKHIAAVAKKMDKSKLQAENST